MTNGSRKEKLVAIVFASPFIVFLIQIAYSACRVIRAEENWILTRFEVAEQFFIIVMSLSLSMIVLFFMAHLTHSYYSRPKASKTLGDYIDKRNNPTVT